MGKGGSSQVVSAPAAKPVITPAVARSISQDTEAAQTVQQNDRARRFGIRGTYLDAYRANRAQGGKSTLGGE